MVSAINKLTGEVVELDTDTPEQLVQAWKMAQEYEKVSTQLKAQLKELVPKLTGDRGESEEVSGYVFKVQNIQRMNYDKAILRQNLDEDTFDLLLKPDKTAIDKYIKENLETLGETSSVIRQAMIPEGNAYQVIKLEKTIRD
jgi:transcription initiation factor IIE alpha subunit